LRPSRVALIPGDGIGVEVIEASTQLLREIESRDRGVRLIIESLPWGTDYYLAHGSMMPINGLDVLRTHDAILLGAVGDTRVPDHITLRELLLAIRQSFDQFVNLRPVRLLPGVTSPLRHRTAKDLDMVFVRENSEGEYAGAGEWLFPGSPEEVAIQMSIFSRRGVERIIRYAFVLAARERRRVVSVSKGNALNYSAVLWDRIFEEVREEYLHVDSESMLIDAAAMRMVLDPARFGVIVGSNLFGDILSDLGAGLVGGLGLTASANVCPDGVFPSMFEPVHGSAPDIAGRHVANPIGAFSATALMMGNLGHEGWERSIYGAIDAVLSDGKVRTPDLGGTSQTEHITEAVLDALVSPQ
jgi:tartrate dehydrogenase/decarboxylase/D-malate dehydrogenase